MWIEIFDQKAQKQLCRADLLIGPGTLIVQQFLPVCPGEPEGVKTKADLYRWLTIRARSMMEPTYEFDDVVLKKLDLLPQKYKFGRMDEACVLYAALCNFQKDEDSLGVWPLHTEVLSVIAMDPKYENLYLWEARKKDGNGLSAPET